MKVITIVNVYTHQSYDVCPDCFDEAKHGDCQVSHGLHYSAAGCDDCSGNI